MFASVQIRKRWRELQEVQVRHRWRQGLRIWQRLTSAHRVLVLALAGGVSVTFTYVAYRLFWR